MYVAELSMKRNLFLSSLLAICSACVVAAPYSGRVFVDKNGNHSYDKGEKVISGVSVSDGLNVVQTDKEGLYNLPGHANGRFVFITIPSGYRAESYYHRIVEGQSVYDFELQRANPKSVKADGTHRFLHISDTHMDGGRYLTASDGYAAGLKSMRDYVENENIAFVIHTGDVAHGGFDKFKNLLNNENLPSSQVFYGIGNHDLLREGEFGEDVFEQTFGPAYYSFEVGNVHYIVTPMRHGDGKPSYSDESIGRWLKNDLKFVAKDKPVIAFNHSVMSADGHFRFGSEKEGYIDLADHNLKAWIYGHWHHDRMYYHDGSDVLMICSPGGIRGSYDHSPSSFRVLTCGAHGELSSEIRYPYINKAVTIASIDNGSSAVTSAGKVPLSVNVYSSASSTQKVTYSCSCLGNEYKGGMLQQRTDFNWSTEMELPASLDGQIVTVKVEATFANGEVAQEHATFRYHKTSDAEIKTGDDWTNLLQNSAHVPNIKDTLQLPLQLAWVQNIGSNIFFTSPLVYKEKVYAASMDDNGKGHASVICLEAATGKICWQYFLRNSVRSSIAAEEGCIFAQDVNGWLYAIDAETGKLAWEKDLKMNKQVPLDDGLATSNGVVYAGTGHSLCAFKAKSGELIWQNKGWNTSHGTSATLTVHDGVVNTHAFWEGTHANDALTGRKLWSKKYHYGSSAAMHNGLLYYINNGTLTVREAKTGRTIIEKNYGTPLKNLSTPLITDGEIIFGTSLDGVMAVDASTLEKKWEFRTGRAMIYTVPMLHDPSSPVEPSPVMSGNIVYIGASDGYLYAIDRKTGLMLWKHAMGAPVLGPVAISGNALFAVDFSGNIYGFVTQPNR